MTLKCSPLVAYPNSEGAWDAAARGWSGPPAYDVTLAPTWVAAGARYVGGCCRVGPDDIARLAALVAGPG